MVGSASQAARVVHIHVEEGREGLFYASSPDLKGLLVAERSLEEVYAALPDAIVEMYAACSVDVIVAPMVADAARPDEQSFVAMPSYFAQRASPA